ncbi:MAG TPA: hypothetical protein VKY51_07765 [Fredinandcohnia sp.]|nr:hypothetical protein [Fredinandcohnia sp.]
MRPAWILLAACAALGCGEIVLEGPQQEAPAPLCDRDEYFDPETGRCTTMPCVWDEDCEEGERCDRVEGVCRPEEE